MHQFLSLFSVTMLDQLVIVLTLEAVLSLSYGQLNLGFKREAADSGQPLFLTPYIEKGDIAEAKQKAKVKLNDTLSIESYAGFFTVNKTHDSNQFVWYFPSMSPDKDQAPVLVWLQGGPGGSSLFGVFCENGPFVEKDGQFVFRNYHWVLNNHMIYIDNPVGSGFSYTKHDEGYCTDETQVGDHLYSTITQFFQLFPDLQKNDFFITGESYAGKFAPALAHTILEKDSSANTKINLKGLIIGGAFINPETQIRFDVDQETLNNTKLPDCDPDGVNNDNYVAVLNQNEVRKALHVGDTPYAEVNPTVYDKLGGDYFQSMAPWLSELLDHYPVTLYGGDHDQVVPQAGVEDFLHNHFNFTGQDEYKSASRYCWRVDGELAGRVRRTRLLTDIYVLNATHYAIRDQPKRTLDMITRLTREKGFDQKEVCMV